MGIRLGGRAKGTPNKDTLIKREIATAAAKAGVTPLAYMLGIMRNPKAKPDRRDEMAKAAAPYVHPRLISHRHGGDAGAPAIKFSIHPGPVIDAAAKSEDDGADS